MISWSKRLDAAVRRVTGPEDETDESVNCDPDSTVGEDDELGQFDESPIEVGWNEDDEFGDDDGEDEEDDPQ